MFKFKSSKKSNNGTDVNAGQIPQLMYRLPAHDSSSTSRKADQMEPAHILAPEFSRTVTSVSDVTDSLFWPEEIVYVLSKIPVLTYHMQGIDYTS